MVKKAPVIGITSAFIHKTLNTEGVYVHHDYHRAVLSSGGIPVLLPPVPLHVIPSYLKLCDGFILSGGEDVDPAHYGQPPHEKLGFVFQERDEFELNLTTALLRKPKPVLAICRGLQLLNISLGGTLWQDLPSQRSSPILHDQKSHRSVPVHHVTLSPQSRLAAILKSPSVNVNSLHHQGIDRLGKGLVDVGHSSDGLIEAVEMEGKDFIIGVQWHPESMVPESNEMNRLFSHLVYSACR